MKRYIAPQTDIVSVSINQFLLADSFGLSSDYASITDGNYNTLSRHGSIWGEDEEEE